MRMSSSSVSRELRLELPGNKAWTSFGRWKVIANNSE